MFKIKPVLCLLFLCSFLVLVGSVANATPVDELFFSEYIEGSSNNKALEIYNGTGSAIDLAIAGYSVQMFFNGAITPGATLSLSGIVGSGDVFVLAHSSAVTDILAKADQTSGTWFNGDDAIVLRKGVTVIDSIGQVGFDPGTEWGSGLTSTADNTLRRKASVFAGDLNAGDVFDPSLEWEGFVADTFGGLGDHSIDSPLVVPPPAVPEPATMTLLGAGLAGIAVIRRQRKR